MPTINGQRVLNSAVPTNDRGGINKISNKEQAISGGQVGALNIVQPTVSAKDLANPVPQVNPPAPTTPVSNNRTGAVVDNVLRDTQGFITNQSAEAQKARELANTLGAFGEQSGAGDLRNTLNNQYQIPENLKTLQDIQLQLSSNKTSTGLQQSQITNAPGQTVGQAQREVTQADREGAIRDAGLAARAAVLQGNIETASSLVSQAVSDFNADRTAKNQNILQQLDYYQSISDEQTGQLIEQEKRKYEADQAAIERVQSAVDEAMASGAATERDIAQLTNPKLTDEERLAVAQGISARAASSVFNQESQLRQAQINSANRANQPGERLRQTSVQEIDGKKVLIDEQTGEVIKEFGAGDGTLSELRQASIVSNINATDSLKNDKGMARAVGVRGLARFTPFSADEGEYKNFIASVDQLTKGLTRDELARAKEMGITFGALSEGELGLIADAATKINNWRVSEDGKTQYYEASEKDFKKELDLISNFKKLDAVLKGVPPESIGVIQTEDGHYWTTNSDGTVAQLR